ncbi:hypothetical protein [Streptomyces iconiensis]|uniref:Uncharacterized protein n=1 Tax=Streptomyces iconiensis TaxID=1384038 RepID=A0ABT6ZTJ7_9ACTN|nr:hypothetical protein [Streptomyces iconiensis]MDJ1132385.1 hypothetical protein [Streptomyces iconiensis]
MSSGHGTVTAFFTVITGLVLVIVGLVLDWPPWVWGTVAMAFTAAALLARRLMRRPVDPLGPEFTHEPDVPIPPPERRERVLRDVALPTSEPDYDFRFSATVRWCPLDPPRDGPPFSAAGVAVDAVLERAGALTETREPHRGSLAQHQLDGELAVMRPDSGGRVLAMAEDVTLSLSEADALRLRKLSTVRKDEVLWSHERRYERDRREYLREDVLSDTGSAVVWWLTKNDEQISKTVEDLGVLAQLSAAANNLDVPERFAHIVPHPPRPPEPDEPTEHYGHGGSALNQPGLGANGAAPPSPADHFERLLGAMGVPAEHADSGVLARCLHEGARAVGRTEAAEAIRLRFDPAAIPAAEDSDPNSVDPAQNPPF